ncbi:MAG: hypothetical protein JWQ78_2236 [Sediminibacterium sp.]|nr:hypothetical protein [Sediminibacterium sp.]
MGMVTITVLDPKTRNGTDLFYNSQSQSRAFCGLFCFVKSLKDPLAVQWAIFCGIGNSQGFLRQLNSCASTWWGVTDHVIQQVVDQYFRQVPVEGKGHRGAVNMQYQPCRCDQFLSFFQFLFNDRCEVHRLVGLELPVLKFGKQQ